MDQKKFIQMIKNNIVVISTLFLNITTLSCQQNSTALEYGKLINLEKIDWEKQNLDKLFSEIVYEKIINFKESDSIYKGNKPLKIQWYFNYNVNSDLSANQIDESHFKIIQPNENYLKPRKIYRSYIGVSNEELQKKGSFGYYGDKSITFDKLETISSGNENLALIRFNGDIDNPKQAIEKYNTLKKILEKKFKDYKFSSNILNEYPIYEWKSSNQKIKISLDKGISSSLNSKESKEIFTIFLEIIYYNDKTKEQLKGIF